MARRIKPNSQLFEEIVAAVPEGYIGHSVLAERLKINSVARASLKLAEVEGKIGVVGNLYFDPARLTSDQVANLSAWCRPELPPISTEKKVLPSSIMQRRLVRAARLS